MMTTGASMNKMQNMPSRLLEQNVLLFLKNNNEVWRFNPIKLQIIFYAQLHKIDSEQ